MTLDPEEGKTRNQGSPRFVLMAVGNPQRRDDGMAYLTARLIEEGDKQEEWLIIPCGIYPENFTAKARKPDPELVVILDVVEMGLEPGDIRIIQKLALDTILLTTHRIPLSFLVDYLAKEVKKVVFMGVQPLSLEDGEGLSAPVDEAARVVASALLDGSWKDFERIQ